MAGAKHSITFLFLVSSFLWASSWFYATEASSSSVSIVKGLSWSFYDCSCPKMESIIRKQLKKVFKDDIGQAAGLLRIHFHDCFVQGCDGSVLLDGSTSGPGEQQAPPNLTLRAKAFAIIDQLRTLVANQCGHVVSCSDIVAIAARDSVYLSGGPDYNVPLGRRDGLNFATQGATIANLPSPFDNATTVLAAFATKNLTATDLVALSGAHTIGLADCTAFTNRLYPTQDPTMDNIFAAKLKLTCPAANTINTTNLDVLTPNAFDNKYHVDLVKRQGLFTSDQDLYTNKRTRGIVTRFAANQTLFFEKFASAMVKMGQLSVLTGKKGEIRANCSARNPGRSEFLASVVDQVEESEGLY